MARSKTLQSTGREPKQQEAPGRQVDMKEAGGASEYRGCRDCGDELRAGLRERQKSGILRERVLEDMTQNQTFRVHHREAWGSSLSVSRARDYGGPFFTETEALVSGE